MSSSTTSSDDTTSSPTSVNAIKAAAAAVAGAATASTTSTISTTTATATTTTPATAVTAAVVTAPSAAAATTKVDSNNKADHHHAARAPNTIYRKAIMKAMENLHDFQSRSNIEWIRKYAQDVLLENGEHIWNETLFVKTLKQIADKGDVDLSLHILAELSPSYKRKVTTAVQSSQLPPPLLPPAQPAHLPQQYPIVNVKEKPHRPTEHEKWKIVPKKVYDKSTIVNPMDTH